MKYNFLVIIQARLGSTRYPDKVLEKLGKKTLIETIVKRLSKSKLVDKIIVDLLKKKKINFYTGDERNVLLRYYSLAKKFKPTHVVRVCGDCPFSDYKILDKMIQLVKTRNYDYISNTNPPTFPDGLDLEVFSTKSLLEARKKAKHSFDKEHVTPFIIRNTKNLQYINCLN